MEILNDKVAAAVVTYNRLDLLNQVINGIRNQSKKGCHERTKSEAGSRGEMSGSK